MQLDIADSYVELIYACEPPHEVLIGAAMHLERSKGLTDHKETTVPAIEAWTRLIYL